MKQLPILRSVAGIVELNNTGVMRQIHNNVWVHDRPYSGNAQRIFYRLKLAWGVFTGKYDALVWSTADNTPNPHQQAESKCPYMNGKINADGSPVT